MTIFIDPLVYFFTAILLYYSFLFILSKKDPRHRVTNSTEWGYVIFIPVHNEEKVIHATLQNALRLSVNAHIIVINDGSTDATGKILQTLRDDKLHIVTRTYPNAKQGKGEALNSAYAFFHAHHKAWFPKTTPEMIIITVLDADSYLDSTQFEYIAGMLETHGELGGIQIPVTIEHPDKSMLLRMQDREFVGFSCFVQQARHWFSSLGLGGNGQFIRYSALLQLGSKPWTQALSEDLDIGIRLLLCGIKLGYCNAGFVHQQGLISIKPLLKQRTRWVQGHFQSWRYLPAIWKSKLPVLTKLDLSLYLTLVASVFIVMVNILLNLIVLAGVVNARSAFFEGVSTISPSLSRALIVILTIGPAIFFVATYNKFSRNKVPWTSWPTIIAIFCVYGWIWLYASVAALIRLVRRQNSWVKTERVTFS